MEIRIYEQIEDIQVNINDSSQKVNLSVEDRAPRIEVRVINEVSGDDSLRPVSEPDNYELNEETTLTVEAINGVLSNDYDLDSEVIIAELVSTTTYGDLVLNRDGGFIYTPNANFYGVDSFTYRSYDGNKYSAPTTVQLTVHDVPEQPTAATALTFYDVTTESLTLSWEPGEYVDTYDVERRVSGGTWSVVAGNLTETAFNDTGLSDNTTYEYRVRSINAVGSALSTVATVTTEEIVLLLEPEVQTYSDISGITNVDHLTVVDNVIKYYKEQGVWTNINTFFPMLGETATQRGYNVKDVSQYNMTFSGGWVFSAAGNKGNGSNTKGYSGLHYPDATYGGFAMAILDNESTSAMDFGQSAPVWYFTSDLGGNARLMTGSYTSAQQTPVSGSRIGIYNGHVDGVDMHLFKNDVKIITNPNGAALYWKPLSYGSYGDSGYHSARMLGGLVEYVGDLTVGAKVREGLRQLETGLGRLKL